MPFTKMRLTADAKTSSKDCYPYMRNGIALVYTILWDLDLPAPAPTCPNGVGGYLRDFQVIEQTDLETASPNARGIQSRPLMVTIHLRRSPRR